MIKKLVKGKIYFYEYRDHSWGELFKMDDSNFSLASKRIPKDPNKSNSYFSIIQLATNKRAYSSLANIMNKSVVVKSIKTGEVLIQEIPLENLPLYISMPYKTKAFTELLKGKE